MEKANNDVLFEQIEPVEPYEISTVFGIVTFPYVIDKKKSNPRKSKIIVLTNGAIVRYDIFQNDDIADEVVNLQETLPNGQTMPLIFPISDYWVSEIESRDEVILFYVYKTTPRVASPLPLMNNNTLERFIEFDHVTQKMVRKHKWMIKYPAGFLFLMANDQQIGGFYWSISNVQIALSGHGHFVSQWGKVMENVKIKRQIAESYRRDVEIMSKIDWFRASSNNFLRKLCQVKNSVSIPKFQMWVDGYFGNLMTMGNGNFLFPIEFNYNVSPDVPVLYWHTIGRFQVTPEQVRFALLSFLNQQKKFPVPVVVRGQNESHQLVIFVDSKERTAKIFDPNGTDFDVWSDLIRDDDQRDVAKRLNREMLESVGLKVGTMKNICFNYSDMKISCAPEFLGYCMWISYFVIMISVIHDVSSKTIIDLLMIMGEKQRIVAIETFIGFLIHKYKRSLN